jgi:hypothetical protein
MSKKISLFVQHSYVKNSLEFSVCLSEKIENWYLIYDIKTFYDESLLKEYIEEYQEQIDSYLEKNKLFINILSSKFNIPSKLKSMKFSPHFVSVPDWDFIRSLAFYINTGKLKFDSPDVDAKLKQSLLRDFRGGRTVSSLTGCVGIALDHDFERVGSTADLVKLAS